MFADEPSDPCPDSAHQAWLAYLDRMSTSDLPSSVGESGPWKSSLAGQDADSEKDLAHELLSEEDFRARLALLDELSLREMEGRLSVELREQMDELRLILLGELEAVAEEDALLSPATRRPAALRRSSQSRSDDEAPGARHRRHQWRKQRRGDRWPGE